MKSQVSIVDENFTQSFPVPNDHGGSMAASPRSGGVPLVESDPRKVGVLEKLFSSSRATDDPGQLKAQEKAQETLD